MNEFKVGDTVEVTGKFKVLEIMKEGGVVLRVTPFYELAFAPDCLRLVSKAAPVNKYLDACSELNVYDKVLVRDDNEDEWIPSFFRKIEPDPMILQFFTIQGGIWNQCVPWEGNEHLCGTTDEYDARVIDNGRWKG